jgi:hypothetical protein
MRTPRTLALIPVAALTLVTAACGGDSETSDTVATTTSAAPTTTGAPETTEASTTVATTAAPAATEAPTTLPTPDSVDLPPIPVGTNDIPLPPPVDTVDAPLLIEVEVGLDSGPDRIETVAAGSIVTISIVNPLADDEFHLHDYDLGDDQLIPAGQPATFTFVADRTGDFELESHDTGDVYLVLRVV